MTSATSRQNDPGGVRPGPGPWVGVAPDGSALPAPYLTDVPGGFPSGASGRPDFDGASSTARRRRRAEPVVFGAAALTGVLAVVAPFLVLWRYGFSNGVFAARTVVNGWGSVSARPASFASSHSHDTDYGLPMVIAAVFLLGGAVAYAITRRAVATAWATSVGASLAAGTALLLALDRGGRDSATTGTDTWAVGAGFWLIMTTGALGVVVALAAVVLATLDLRAGQATAQLPTGLDSAPYYDDRVWIAPPNPAWFTPADPAQFTPPWSP